MKTFIFKSLYFLLCIATCVFMACDRTNVDEPHYPPVNNTDKDNPNNTDKDTLQVDNSAPIYVEISDNIKGEMHNYIGYATTIDGQQTITSLNSIIFAQNDKVYVNGLSDSK